MIWSEPLKSPGLWLQRPADSQGFLQQGCGGSWVQDLWCGEAWGAAAVLWVTAGVAHGGGKRGPMGSWMTESGAVAEGHPGAAFWKLGSQSRAGPPPSSSAVSTQRQEWPAREAGEPGAACACGCVCEGVCTHRHTHT